ncbi:uncharacterized protein LOC129779976 [Toxorhynchites rutilus septentrionalis]|uniref:uncharacterized protein LOC129779976 n=1 Tax=Toxorhynchites rutilus septentrionalis TaxID=329112 RepID=UPI0024793F9A|nr:uncharacterized protein LOC129779976 [Toxorhynchites rutilus septentrionalis]
MAEKQVRLRSNSVVKSDADMTVADLASLMQSQLNSYQQSTKEDFKKLSASLSSLTSQLSKFRDNITTEMERLREENKQTFTTISSSIEKSNKDTSLAVDRSTRRNDLVISGIPFVDGENLLSYFHSWCRTFGYVESEFPLVDIRRLSKGALAAGKVYMILLQFAITIQRNDFYSRYLRSHSLSLSGIGFSVNKRIYINENLGPSIRALRSKALHMKKEGKLSGVFTRGGILLIKRNGDEKEITVSSDSDLSESI